MEALPGAEREALDLLERRRSEFRSAVAAEGERRLAEATQRFEAERAELQHHLDEVRTQAQDSMASARESHEQLGRELEQERTRAAELEAQLEERADALEAASANLEQVHQ